MNKLQNGSPAIPVLAKDKAKDWQLEILMEKLRSKASQVKSLPELSKNVRMTLLEKRYALDNVEKTQHQKCLDTLQHVIKVTGLQSMIERLESLTRQLGLRFVVEPSGVFIFSDMFYLEIILETTGAVKDVKIHHEGKVEQQSSMELVNCLSRGDFTDFTTQLEGFVAIYQLNAEKKIKCKAFTALESLEADLCTLAQLQTFMKEPFNLLHKSPVGVLEKRRGGHPMKLTYFVSPYDLLNVDKHEIDAISIETVISKGLGHWVTVCMESSTTRKLQTSTLITVNRSMNGKNTPSYSPSTSQNTALVPACFSLKLNKPMPVSLSLVKKIQQIEQWPELDNAPQPLLNLIVSHTSEGKMSCLNNRGLFVNLPDQTHCYCMTENRNMNGIFLSSIPFTHPAHVSKVLMILREQALFNTMIGSCVRPKSRQNFDNLTMFEVSALSSTQISISLEHPLEECMATADFDLSDISNLICKIQNPGTPPPMNAPDIISELATKVLNKSFSIPVTLRAVIKMWERQAAQPKLYPGQENFSLPLGSVDPGGHKGPGAGPSLAEFGGLQDKIKQEPGTNGHQGQGHHHIMLQEQQGMWNESMMSSNFQNIPPSDRVLSNIEILSDSPDKLTIGKRQKRKAADDLWRSGKRKVGASAEDSELLETSSCDSTSRSTPISQETEVATPNSGSQSDLELSNVDSSDFLSTIDKTPGDFSGQPETVDMEEILSSVPRDHPIRKTPPERSPSSGSSIISDLSEKNMVPPNVSITPITNSPSTNYTCASIEKRTGIEIIPITPPVTTFMPTSITITPITPSVKPFEDRRDKKSSRSSREDKEKKRKRKRDESPMGPPDKVPPKQDPLSKPVSVSIKPAESPPLPGGSTPTSPNMMRKFSPSPTSNRPISLTGKLSPSLLKPKSSSSASASHHSPSPKNSPAHIPSSPKHSITGISSPKHHGTSPKHPSASGSGKPSMSTLKNAANSPSSKSSSEKSKSKDSSRDKDKSRSIFGSSNTKSKSSSLKVKPLDMNLGSLESGLQESLPSPGTDSKTNPNILRNRKGSLSAIVDKLNIKVNAQHSDIPTDLSSKPSSKVPGKDGKSSGKLTGDMKNSEYMVKTSSDGMKLTINKPRTKENKSSSSAISASVQSNLSKPSQVLATGSPKVHTGLKPGVNSGPASKKPQQLQKSSSSSNIPNSSTTYSSSLKSNLTKQPGNLISSKLPSSGLPKSISKPTTSPKIVSSNIAELNRNKDRLKPSKSSSEKSIFASMKERGKSSPTPNDSDTIYKIQSKVDPFPSALMMEGMMKTLDKNFQIPKLSDKKKNELNNVNRSTVDTKIFDMMVKNDIKYPLSIPAMNSLDQKIRNNMGLLGSMGKGDDLDDKKKDGPPNLSGPSN